MVQNITQNMNPNQTQEISYEAVVSLMNHMEFFGMKLGLERIQKALTLFDNPEKEFKIIHVAGTNGKGSVSAMVAKGIEEAGHKVGLFTSPHLVDIRERIRINNNIIGKKEFRDVFLEAAVRTKDVGLTFFELITLMAVLHFKKKKVDYAVFEVGLGGRFDATNFGNSLISVITSISLDHMHILGKTVEEIAGQKCSIIHTNQTVVTTASNEKVMNIIRNTASKNHSELIIASPTRCEVILKGFFQKENAGIAEAVLKKLGISDDIIQKAFLNVNWPGRMEFIEKNVLLDCAHNPSGIKVLAEYVSSLKFKKVFIIFGVSSNKDYPKMLSLLPKYDELIFTQSSVTSRCLSLDNIPENIALKYTKIKNPEEALSYAKSKAKKDDLIIVCGSIFLIGDVKRGLNEAKYEKGRVIV